MLRIITGTTKSNPNDTSNRYIDVELHPTKQLVKAVYSNPLTLDQREQKPNIKIGSEVLILVDDETFSFYVLGTIQQGLKTIQDKKIYIIENSDEVNIKTDKLFISQGISDKYIKKTEHYTNKLKIENSQGNEVISLISEFIDIVKNKVSVGNLGQPVKLDPDTINKLDDLKNRIDTFKE